MNENDLKWWDEFYTEMERGLVKYTRPADWKERAQSAETKQRKPVQNQYEGRRRSYHHE